MALPVTKEGTSAKIAQSQVKSITAAENIQNINQLVFILLNKSHLNVLNGFNIKFITYLEWISTHIKQSSLNKSIKNECKIQEDAIETNELM